MAYMPRIIDEQLERALGQSRIVSIEGARAIGKTTTAARQAETIFDLQRPGTFADLEHDPEIIARAAPPVLVDEWHLQPKLMNLMKTVVDAERSAGRFILTGTPSETQREGVHSGVGRVTPLDMHSMSLVERGFAEPTVSLRRIFGEHEADLAGSTELTRRDYAETLLRSGFPECQGEQQQSANTYLDAYVRRVVSRDMSGAGGSLRRTAVGPVTRWLRAYAEATATDAKFSTIRDVAHAQDGQAPARPTIDHYRTVLESLGVLAEQPPWDYSVPEIAGLKTGNLHHLVDPAVAAHLLKLWSADELMRADATTPRTVTGKSVFGLLFQSLVHQSVKAYAQPNDADVCWLGTRKGRGEDGEREVDIVLRQRQTGKIVALEVKLGDRDDYEDGRHLRWLRDKAGFRWADGIIVNTSSAARRRNDGLGVVPAALLGP